jgi:hypothetical protein
MSGLESCDAIAGWLQAGLIPWRDSGYECITREQSDLTNPDRATAQTIARMAQLTSESIGTPRLHSFARSSAQRWRGGPVYKGRAVNWEDERQLSCSIWYGTNSSMKFVEHSAQIRALLNEQDQLQLLISPDLLLTKRRPAGDCAVYTPLVCAALGTLGIHYEFVTLACDPRDPDLFTHVYARAVLRDSHRLPLDASHGKFPGWEVPREHQIRKQVWDEAGNPIEDAQPHPVPHLGQYSRVRRVMPRRIVGFGQVADGIDVSQEGYPVTVDTSGGSTTTLGYPGMPSGIPSGYPVSVPVNAPTVPSTPSFNWDQALASFLGQGIKLAGQVVAPQTTLIRGPGGQLYYQAPASSGGAVPTAGILSPTGGGGSFLLIGGAVLIGIIALSVLGKR